MMNKKSILNWKFILLPLFVLIILLVSFLHNELSFIFKEIITITLSIFIGVLSRDIDFQYSKKEILLKNKQNNINKIYSYISAINDLSLYHHNLDNLSISIEKDSDILDIYIAEFEEMQSQSLKIDNDISRFHQLLESNLILLANLHVDNENGNNVTPSINTLVEEIDFLKLFINSISDERSELANKIIENNTKMTRLKKHMSTDKMNLQHIREQLEENQKIVHSLDIKTFSLVLDSSGNLDKLLDELLILHDDLVNQNLFIAKKVEIIHYLDSFYK